MPAFVRCVRALPCAVLCSKSRCRLCRFQVPLFSPAPYGGFGGSGKIGSVPFGLPAVFSPFAFCLVVFRERQRVKDKSGWGGGANARRRRAPRAPQAPAPPARLGRFERRGARRRGRCGARAPPLRGSAAGAAVPCRRCRCRWASPLPPLANTNRYRAARAGAASGKG
jgi:hypothetical protein